MTRLERLTVAGFRGIVHSELPFKGGSIVLGGANGTGKTAFVDAIEFLFTGNIAPLSGAAGLSLREHAGHVNATPGSTSVSASFADPPGEIVRLLSGPVDVPSALDSFARRGSQATFVLRRSQLQEFIHARPAERYKQLADLIGAESLDRTDNAMKRARDLLERALQEAESQIIGLERRMSDIPEEVPESEILAEANERLRELGFAHELSSLDDVAAVRSSIVRQVARKEPDRRDMTQRVLRAELEQGAGLDHLRESLAAFASLLPAKTDAGPDAQMMDLLQILQRGREYLRATDSNHCPLCEQSIEPRRVLSQLVDRIAGLEAVNLQREQLERGGRELDLALQEVTARLRAVERSQRDAGIRGNATEAMGNAITMLRESLRGGATREQAEMSARLEDAAERWTLWRRETIESLPAEEEPEAVSESTTAADQALTTLQYVAAQIAQGTRGLEERSRLRRQIEETTNEIGRRRRALGLARVIYNTYLRVKNDEIQRVFDELQSDLVRFYDFLHPGEGHGKLAIAMDLRKRGSSELRMSFFGQKEQNPRAFSSEGHLDSLGLCIFLAFFARFDTDWPLLVLDDVVSSIDAAHKRRVADLLFKEFGDRQLFITTHDSRWFSDLQRSEIEFGHDHRTKNMVIDSWTLEEGPQLREMRGTPGVSGPSTR